MITDCRITNIRSLIETALEEDIGPGDITTSLISDQKVEVKARVLANEDLILAGREIFFKVFECLDSGIVGKGFFEDGEKVKKGEVVAELRGDALSILKGERVALNFLQHLSGIASLTREVTERVKNYKVKLLDTRKTTPGLRALEKYAVRVGGGTNHRFGLFDGILIKENHIFIAGGIKAAIEKAKANAPHSVEIEVEVRDLDEVKIALKAGVDILLLDNMDLNTMRKAVEMVNRKALIEASGNINKDNVEKVAKTGVDFISMGALTHSARAKDLSLEIVEIVKKRSR